MSRQYGSHRRHRDTPRPSYSQPMNRTPQASPSQQPARTPQTGPSTYQEGPNQRRFLADRLGPHNDTSLRSNHMRDHLNQKREKEPPQADPKVERLCKEVEESKRNQELTQKWV